MRPDDDQPAADQNRLLSNPKPSCAQWANQGQQPQYRPPQQQQNNGGPFGFGILPAVVGAVLAGNNNGR